MRLGNGYVDAARLHTKRLARGSVVPLSVPCCCGVRDHAARGGGIDDDIVTYCGHGTRGEYSQVHQEGILGHHRALARNDGSRNHGDSARNRIVEQHIRRVATTAVGHGHRVANDLSNVDSPVSIRVRQQDVVLVDHERRNSSSRSRLGGKARALAAVGGVPVAVGGTRCRFVAVSDALITNDTCTIDCAGDGHGHRRARSDRADVRNDHVIRGRRSCSLGRRDSRNQYPGRTKWNHIGEGHTGERRAARVLQHNRELHRVAIVDRSRWRHRICNQSHGLGCAQLARVPRVDNHIRRLVAVPVVAIPIGWLGGGLTRIDRSLVGNERPLRSARVHRGLEGNRHGLIRCEGRDGDRERISGGTTRTGRGRERPRSVGEVHRQDVREHHIVDSRAAVDERDGIEQAIARQHGASVEVLDGLHRIDEREGLRCYRRLTCGRVIVDPSTPSAATRGRTRGPGQARPHHCQVVRQRLPDHRRRLHTRPVRERTRTCRDGQRGNAERQVLTADGYIPGR